MKKQSTTVLDFIKDRPANPSLITTVFTAFYRFHANGHVELDACQEFDIKDLCPGKSEISNADRAAQLLDPTQMMITKHGVHPTEEDQILYTTRLTKEDVDTLDKNWEGLIMITYSLPPHFASHSEFAASMTSEVAYFSLTERAN